MSGNLRNVKLKIAKIFIENNYGIEKTFNFNELSTILFVRKKEFEENNIFLFEKIKGEYKLKKVFFDEIQEWHNHHNESKKDIENIITQFRNLYLKFHKNYNYSKYYNEIFPLVEKMHWYFLPVYHDFMIINRGINPEDDLKSYYNHFHCLQDLNNYIDVKKDFWKSVKGDVNLDLECKFPIYTNRWGHDDIYKVTRKFDGWYVKHLSINGMSSPDGYGYNEKGLGGFVANFNQDFVDFPKQFHNVIERLWKLADENEMTIVELQEKLLEVAQLVSEVERTVSNYTPRWY